jgi:hypothetical protein
LAGQNEDIKDPELLNTPPKTIREILEELKVNPAAEIVSLLKMGELQDRDRLKGWESLLKYMEPKQVEIRPSDRWLSEAARKPTGQIIQETIFCDWNSDESGQ